MTHSTAQLNASPDDIFVWSDGTWCFREDLEEMSHMSDDYLVVREGSQEYDSFLWAEEAMEPDDFEEFIIWSQHDH